MMTHDDAKDQGNALTCGYAASAAPRASMTHDDAKDHDAIDDAR